LNGSSTANHLFDSIRFASVRTPHSISSYKHPITQSSPALHLQQTHIHFQTQAAAALHFTCSKTRSNGLPHLADGGDLHRRREQGARGRRGDHRRGSLLRALQGDAPGAGLPRRRDAAARAGGVRPGAGDRVRVDAAEGAVRTLLPRHGHPGALRRGGDGVRGGRADEAHDGRAQQAGHALGAHRRDEPRGRRARQNLLQVQRRDRTVLPRRRVRRRGQVRRRRCFCRQGVRARAVESASVARTRS
jgi:hypothetical protein